MPQSVAQHLASLRVAIGVTIGDRTIAGGDADSFYDIIKNGMGVLPDAAPEGTASKIARAITKKLRCVAVGTGPSLPVHPMHALLGRRGERHGRMGRSAPSLVRAGV